MVQYHFLTQFHIVLNNIILYFDILQYYIISWYSTWHSVYLELLLFNINIYFDIRYTPDLDLPKRVHHLSLIYAIFRLLINFTIITYKVIFNYNLRTSSHTCWHTKGLSRCSGAVIILFCFQKAFIYKYRYCSHSWNIQTLRSAN